MIKNKSVLWSPALCTGPCGRSFALPKASSAPREAKLGPGSVALSNHLHIPTHAVVFTRMTLQWRHGNDPPTGTRANKGTQRKRSGLKFSTHKTQGDREGWKTCTSLPARGAAGAITLCPPRHCECGCLMKLSAKASGSSIHGQDQKLREG